MRHHRDIARCVCTARNAYNPALVLASAFLPTTVPRDITQRRRLHNPQTEASRLVEKTLGTPEREEQSTKPPEDGSNEDTKGEEVAKKRGTFAGYEALMSGRRHPIRRTVNDRGEDQHGERTGKSSPVAFPTGLYAAKTLQRKGHDPSDQTSARAKTPVENLTTRMDYRKEKERKARERATRLGSGRVRGFLVEMPKWDARREKKRRSERQYALRSDTSERENGTASPSEPQVVPTDTWVSRMLKISHLAKDFTNRAATSTPTPNMIESWKEQLDYKTVFGILPREPASDVHIPIPWAVSSSTSGLQKMTSLERLNAEIVAFEQYARPTAAETAAREAVRDEMMASFSKAKLTQTALAPFGSDLTGLSSAMSDLDFRIFWKAYPKKPARYGGILAAITRLAEAMRASQDWLAVTLRESARFPIINAQHKASGLDIQIVSSPDTAPQREAQAHYLERVPNLRPLYFVVKTMFDIRGLVNVFNGGIGSYGLFVMLVMALTRRGDAPLESPAHQLLQFLAFYQRLDCNKYGIALTPKGSKFFLKHDEAEQEMPIVKYIRAAHARADHARAGQWSIGKRKAFQPYLLCLQDPADPFNDLGKKTNAIKYIHRTLGWARKKMITLMVDDEEGAPSLLEPIVGRCHEVYAERRQKVEEYGLWVLSSQGAESRAMKLQEEQETARATPTSSDSVKRLSVGPTGAPRVLSVEEKIERNRNLKRIRKERKRQKVSIRRPVAGEVEEGLESFPVMEESREEADPPALREHAW